MTQLNGLEYTEIGANNTVWMFVLLIFYNALLLVYFGATSKIGSRNFEKLSVIAGIPLSLILYAVLPWYLQASAGSGFSYGSVRMVLKFAETTLAVVFPSPYCCCRVRSSGLCAGKMRRCSAISFRSAR